MPTFKRATVLARSLAALLDTTYPADRFEVLVVDDGGEDDTAAVVRAAAANRPEVAVTLVKGSGTGAAAARNLGAAAGKGEFLVFVDDDILVPPGHLAAQVELRAAHGECISGADWWEFTPEVARDLRASPLGRYRLAVEASYRHRATDRWTFPDGLATAHMTVCKTVFEELGGFDERFPRAGVEDWEFCLRARAQGHKLILDNSIGLLHDDKRLDLRQLCAREEWRGVSVGVLARLYPDPYCDTEVFRENSPTRVGDPAVLRARKAIKQTLGSPRVLGLLHRAMRLLERVLRPEAALQRLYTAVISVHYLRGFRTGFDGAGEVSSELGDGRRMKA
jgi:glycosyltransferase involved in cell wall biosynthesis